jgi:RNA polymerase sigma-70 factor (sigma-E family)
MSQGTLFRTRGVLGGVSARTIDLEVVVDDEKTARLRALYAVHVPRVGRLAYLLTGDAALAEDLAQEAFVGLLARLRFIRDEEAVGAYLRRAVVNLVRKHWRKLGIERGYVRREGPGLVGRTTVLPDLAARDEMWQAMAKLTYRQRAAIALRFYEDLSEEETARVLGWPVGTVKSSVARGLRRMREELIGDEDVRT